MWRYRTASGAHQPDTDGSGAEVAAVSKAPPVPLPPPGAPPTAAAAADVADSAAVAASGSSSRRARSTTAGTGRRRGTAGAADAAAQPQAEPEQQGGEGAGMGVEAASDGSGSGGGSGAGNGAAPARGAARGAARRGASPQLKQTLGVLAELGVLPAARARQLPPSETSLLAALDPELAAERVAALRALLPPPPPPFHFSPSSPEPTGGCDPLDALLRERPGTLLSAPPGEWFYAQLGRADAAGAPLADFLEMAAGEPALLDARPEQLRKGMARLEKLLRQRLKPSSPAELAAELLRLHPRLYPRLASNAASLEASLQLLAKHGRESPLADYLRRRSWEPALAAGPLGVWLRDEPEVLLRLQYKAEHPSDWANRSAGHDPIDPVDRPKANRAWKRVVGDAYDAWLAAQQQQGQQQGQPGKRGKRAARRPAGDSGP
ncbi:hypothetical protein GPECTOR_40g531 [Gonium pectorale]|uniref:Uncharacterized protein n=1 Tax=Gonium pectorale TaxID=33097 RepID=A0A150GAC2_GONPE|nr:hypothetical protein GPECTOR_40g531 [Gonium pectorale]|eukprot:KXZ46797.1 hypothetical protein GPECTOR_40g531 [Gonium pectorale]